MREQSHLEDMRAAVRGDRERAAARRAAGDVPPAADPPEAEPVSAPPEPEEAARDAEPEKPSQGFLARLLGR